MKEKLKTPTADKVQSFLNSIKDLPEKEKDFFITGQQIQGNEIFFVRRKKLRKIRRLFPVTLEAFFRKGLTVEDYLGKSEMPKEEVAFPFLPEKTEDKMIKGFTRFIQTLDTIPAENFTTHDGQGRQITFTRSQDNDSQTQKLSVEDKFSLEIVESKLEDYKLGVLNIGEESLVFARLETGEWQLDTSSFLPTQEQLKQSQEFFMTYTPVIQEMKERAIFMTSLQELTAAAIQLNELVQEKKIHHLKKSLHEASYQLGTDEKGTFIAQGYDEHITSINLKVDTRKQDLFLETYFGTDPDDITANLKIHYEQVNGNIVVQDIQHQDDSLRLDKESIQKVYGLLQAGIELYPRTLRMKIFELANKFKRNK
jgi:hypothetical protein